MKRLVNTLAGWTFAVILLAWRRTCRYRIEADPRPALRQSNRRYIYALLHAHQIGAVFINDESRLAAMVSRSADGDILVPSLRLRGVAAVRGSTRKAGQDKGGGEALLALESLVRQGVPALLAVDGPRGPRNCVHRGAATLALATQAAVLPTIVVASRRWLLRRTWDRMQIPQPFSIVRLAFGTPIEALPGESAEALTERIARALTDLERRWDPTEAPIPQAA